MSRENRFSSLSNPRPQSQHRSRNNEQEDNDDTNVVHPARSQLSLDLDVKRARPIIQQYESGRAKVSSASTISASQDIVPSLGLHMLQTGGSPGNNGASAEASNQGVSRPTQKKPQDNHVAPKPSSENVEITEESRRLEKFETSTTKGKTQACNKVAKTVIILIVLSLQLLLMYSFFINSSSDKSTVSSIEAQLKSGVAILASACQHVLSSLASFTKKKSLPLEQLQKRLTLGRSLLSEMNDPLGAHVACSSVTGVVVHQFDAIATTDGGGLKSSVLSCLAILGENENRLLADALLCMGEAKLALFSPTAVSSLVLGSLEARKAELLSAKEALEASISIEPTKSASRAALGLAFLLLGTIHSNLRSESDETVQYLIQSVQHLKVAVGWSTETNSALNAMINMAATHNLGLAYLALDNIQPNKESQFLDLVSSLRSSPQQHPILGSTVLNTNRGAMLLQKGKTDEAILSLEATMGISCDDEDSREPDELSSATRRHQSDACLLLQQNLAVGRGTGKSNEDVKNIPSFGATAQVNMESELLDDDDAEQISELVTTPDDSLPCIQSENSTNETFIESTDISGSSGADTDTQTHELGSSQLPPKGDLHASMIQSDTSSWGVKTSGFARKSSPELLNALAALEQAAKEGLQRPRLLLALAKARSSAGDLSGAIDATLNAINVATTEKETDTMTAYLETLMNKLAGGGNEEKINVREKQPSDDASSKIDRDRTVSELEMKLEIEKLKYRVLEQEHALKYQEMRLVGGHNPTDFGAISRAIDYSRGSGHISPGSISSKYSSDDESINGHVQESKTIDVEQFDKHLEALDSDVAKSTESADLEANVSSEKPAVAIDEVGSDGTESTESDIPAAISSEETAVGTEEVGDRNATIDTAEEEVVANQTDSVLEPMTITLPSLFDPPLTSPGEISATAKSYMKMADAYLDKGKYSLASKQFLKVIRKAPHHLAAHLGYATALERAGKNRQKNDAASAYGNATRVAIIQGDKVDPLAKAGTGGIAESILRRAVKIAQSSSSGRLELLRTLSTYAHTSALAADVYHAIGLELTKQNMEEEATRKDAMEAFHIANEFIITRNDTKAPFHVPSIIEIGKIVLENEGNAVQAIKFFEKVKSLHLEDDDHVKLLVLAGRAHSAVGELDTAISDLTRAISLPQCSSTASAHYELALVLSKNNGDQHEINLHFETALDLGMDPTEEALAALGEHNMSVMRSYNRQHWREYNEGHQGTSGGGIMSGGGVGSQKSVFAPQAGKEDKPSAQSETLTLLEQGAASYDGHVPMGGEIEGGAESNLSRLSGRKQKAQVT